MAVYIYFAVGSIFLGIIIAFIVVIVSANLRIDLSANMWILGIPALLAILLNILFIELYYKFKKK
jgi:multisubunit Na+/H+ antiporter MnhE subunit